MSYNYHFIVIGAGSGGLVVASGVAGLGGKVMLIEKEKMGGDCLNTGCVPSKAFLKIAHGVRSAKDLNNYGINVEVEKVDLKKVMGYVKASIRKITPKDSKHRYEGLGVDVKFGEATIVDKNTVKVNNQTYTAKFIVIATGSSPFIPTIEGLEEVGYRTSNNILELDDLPEDLLVLGAGPIGLELGQGFLNLGSKVHVVNRGDGLFRNDDEEVSAYMLEKLEKQGMEFNMNSEVKKVERNGDGRIEVTIEGQVNKKIVVDNILISIGRKPDTENLGIEKLGIEMSKRGHINVDSTMRTNIKNIFACGDITGNFGFTHMAAFEAGIVIRNAIFKMKYSADYNKVAWTTFTSPEVAHTGLTEKMAKDKNIFGSSIIVDFDWNDRYIVEDENEGFIKVVLDSSDRVIGATVAGVESSEMIHALTVAIYKKMKITDLNNIIIPYPMRGEVIKEVALKKAKEKLTDFNKKVVSKFLGSL